MAKCTTCSAPLPANTNRCNFCNTRSDVDLHAKLPYKTERLASERICPNCEQALQTVSLKMAEPLLIDRCPTCFGLFFDKGEIETVLQNSVSNIAGINLEHIDNINKDRFRKHQNIRYVKCPECQILMDRVNFARRSGVVIDHCIRHGIWLDSGELTHLMEWKKAGGQLLHEEHKKEMEKQRQRKRDVPPLPSSSGDYSATSGGFGDTIGTDLVEIAVGALLDKLFK
jgi:Zn-finger nucleic acid-binding protein